MGETSRHGGIFRMIVVLVKIAVLQLVMWKDLPSKNYARAQEYPVLSFHEKRDM